MSKYAELLAQGWDPAVVTRPVDPELEKMRLAHEREMKRMELELREKVLEAEKERKELREKELEAERERKELREKELDAERDKMMQTDRLEAQRLEFERERSSKARLN